MSLMTFQRGMIPRHGDCGSVSCNFYSHITRAHSTPTGPLWRLLNLNLALNNGSTGVYCTYNVCKYNAVLFFAILFSPSSNIVSIPGDSELMSFKYALPWQLAIGLLDVGHVLYFVKFWHFGQSDHFMPFAITMVSDHLPEYALPTACPKF